MRDATIDIAQARVAQPPSGPLPPQQGPATHALLCARMNFLGGAPAAAPKSTAVTAPVVPLSFHPAPGCGTAEGQVEFGPLFPAWPCQAQSMRASGWRRSLF